MFQLCVVVDVLEKTNSTRLHGGDEMAEENLICRVNHPRVVGEQKCRICGKHYSATKGIKDDEN